MQPAPLRKVIALVGFIAPLAAVASAAAQPATVDLLGIVRDFHAAHPDFDISGSSGHFAGNVDLVADVEGRPVYAGGGYLVSTEWKDSDGRNIAPHMFGVAAGSCYGTGAAAHSTTVLQIGNQSQVFGYEYGVTPPGGVPVVVSTNQTGSGECEVIGNSDVWGDVLVGPGGDPANVVDLTPNGFVHGVLGNLDAPIPVPAISPPAGMPASVGNRLFDSGVTQITTDMRFNNLFISGDARVEIPAGFNVRIQVDGEFFHNANGSATAGLYVEPGAGLDLYLMSQDNDVVSGVMEATNGDPRLLRIYMLVGGSSAKNDFDLQGNGARVRAMMYAPNSDLEMTQSSQFWGTFIGREIDLENRCELYIDMSLAGASVSDSPGAAGATGGDIQSAATFADWFADVLGENLSMTHTITLVRDGGGVYEFLDDAFYPADGRLFGDEAELHNYNFTYQIDADFTYEGCAGQFVEFMGADDMWLFVDGSLVMDVGGVQPMVSQYVELDRLGLTDGDTYRISLFFAQRNTSVSRFRLRTNVVLTSATAPLDMSAAFD
jgi:fibro-slime domain-containing protein